MSSIKFGWNFIFNLPELCQYLSKSDIINISQFSTYNRVKLKSLLFKAINISEAIKLIPYKTSYEGSFDEKYEALDCEFAHIKKHVKSIELDLNTDIVLIPVIVNYFESIESLTISDAALPHPTFEIIFNTLKKLKILKIDYTLILFHPLASEVEDIHLPESITDLYLTHTGGVSTSQFENIQTFMSSESEDDSDVRAVNLKFSTNFYELKKLSFLRGNVQEIMTLESFIFENNQLETVEVYTEQLNPQLFNLLATRCKKLKYVKIYPSPEGPLESNELYNYPTLQSVETLDLFNLYYYENELSYLLVPFPSINHLIISSKHPLFSHVYYYFKKLTKLKKLTIYPGESDEAIVNSNLYSDTITSLEFKKFESLKFWKFELLKSLPNVNKISVDIENFTENELDMLKWQFENSAGWRVIDFKQSINCYKL